MKDSRVTIDLHYKRNSTTKEIIKKALKELEEKLSKETGTEFEVGTSFKNMSDVLLTALKLGEMIKWFREDPNAFDSGFTWEFIEFILKNEKELNELYESTITGSA